MHSHRFTDLICESVAKNSMAKKSFDNDAYPLQKETYLLNGIAMEIHRILGRGFLEIVYKDALELELRKREIPFYSRKGI